MAAQQFSLNSTMYFNYLLLKTCFLDVKTTKKKLHILPSILLLYQNQLHVTCLFSFFSSAPCPPTGVSSFMNCIANIAVVSWTGSAGAMFYIATVTQGDGESKSCFSDVHQCGVPNVRCGQNYTVTVTASNNQCNSDPSKANAMKSGKLH